MKRISFAAAAFCLLLGATSTQPATKPSTRPQFRGVDLTYRVYLERLDLRITVDAIGSLHSVCIDNRSWGKGDIDARNERVTIRSGQLTPKELDHLAQMFNGFDDFKSETYPGVVDGPSIVMRSGSKVVMGGSGCPQQVLDIQAELFTLNAAMPPIEYVPVASKQTLKGSVKTSATKESPKR